MDRVAAARETADTGDTVEQRPEEQQIDDRLEQPLNAQNGFRIVTRISFMVMR